MLRMIDSFRPLFAEHGATITTPDVVQTLSVEELKVLVPQHDGWIIGDDPATKEVLEAGKAGKLRAAVKWGIGVDNVDLAACKDLAIPITNTPNMFGSEVADIAVGYVIALARQTFEIDRGIRAGGWPKPCGISLAGKTVALVGYGDVGKRTAKRLLAADMRVVAYDPWAADDPYMDQIKRAVWPEDIEKAHFIVITCALTPSSRHMLNAKVLSRCMPNVRVVNVARGAIIDEGALAAALKSGLVFSAALDVYENEPLSVDTPLRGHPRCVLGSHNASNTAEAVARTSRIAIEKLMDSLGGISQN